MTLVHHRRADEEPDFDDDEYVQHLVEHEDDIAEGYCDRCGIKGHRGRDCPTVTPDLLRNQMGAHP